MTKKSYTILIERKGREREVSGTVEELVKYFQYTLDSAHSWDNKINTKPKTARSLESQLDKCVSVLQGSCYERDSYTLI